MTKSFYLLVFVLAVALAYAGSQTSPSSSTNQPSGQVKPNTPGTPEQTPAPGMQAGPASTAPASPADAQSAIETALKNDPRLSGDNVMVSVTGNEVSLTGEVASDKEKDAAKSLAEKYAGGMRVKDHLKVRGAAPGPSAGNAGPVSAPDNTLGSIEANASARMQNPNNTGVGGSASNAPAATQSTSSGSSGMPGATNEPQTSANENGPSPGDLQGQIQNALRNEPTLSNDNVNVTVSEDEIGVSGTVATAKEKITAKRIVQSYAGNRKVKDHLAVKGRNPDTTSNPRTTENVFRPARIIAANDASNE